MNGHEYNLFKKLLIFVDGRYEIKYLSTYIISDIVYKVQAHNRQQ